MLELRCFTLYTLLGNHIAMLKYFQQNIRFFQKEDMLTQSSYQKTFKNISLTLNSFTLHENVYPSAFLVDHFLVLKILHISQKPRIDKCVAQFIKNS